MILTLDAGNTSITMVAYDSDGKVCFSARLATDKNRTSDQYAVEIKDILSLYGIEKSDLKGAVIGSVVPVLSDSLFEATRVFCGLTPLRIGPGVKTGLNILIENPAQLGADLVSQSVAAIKKYPLPCLIFNVGAATTLSVIDKAGSYIGCAIMPGVMMSIDALSSGTSQLPQISFSAPASVIGKNTIDSMKAGIVFGNAAMLDGLVDKANEEIGKISSVIATGDSAEGLISHCKHKIIYEKTLVNDGLMMIWEKNKKITSNM